MLLIKVNSFEKCFNADINALLMQYCALSVSELQPPNLRCIIFIFLYRAEEFQLGIVASPSCTEYHWGTLIAFYVQRIKFLRSVGT